MLGRLMSMSAGIQRRSPAIAEKLSWSRRKSSASLPTLALRERGKSHSAQQTTHLRTIQMPAVRGRVDQAEDRERGGAGGRLVDPGHLLDRLDPDLDITALQGADLAAV